jgi:hypothetical protein
MAITSFSFTLCVSSQQYEVEDIVRLAGEAASRAFAASLTHNDNRVFWDFSNNTEDVTFDEVWPIVVNWATRYVDALALIEDAMFTLWCTINTNTEFAGLALDAAHMLVLGSRKIDFVVSAYTQPVGDGSVSVST